MGGEEEQKLKSEEKEKEKLIPVPNFDDRRDEYRFSFVEVPDECVFEGNFFFSAYKRFAKEHNHTMGFNLEHFFPKPVDKLLTLKSVPLSPLKIAFEACEKAVNTVLDYLHKKNGHSLLLVRIVKANHRSDSLFFVTFEAKTKDEGLIEEYQSVIFRHLDHDQIVLHMFRKIGAVKGAVQYDCRENYKFITIGKVQKNDFKSHEQYVAYCKYAKEHDVSEGFDIIHFPRKVGGKKTLKRLHRTLDETLFQDCKVAVQDVLEYLETKREHNLALVRVVKANYCEPESSVFGNVNRSTKTNGHNYRPTSLFYFTFETRKDKHSKQIEEYQSVIVRECSHGKLALHMFRKKIGVKPAVKYDCRESYLFIPIGLTRKGDFKSKADFDAFLKYAKEHNNSEGFAIKHYYYSPLGWWLPVLHPVHYDDKSWKYCKMGVQNVLKYLENKEECTLTYKGIIKANYDAAYQFFVTFLAEDELGGVNEYQSVFYSLCTNGEIELNMFRRRGDVIGAVNDRRESYYFRPVGLIRENNFKSKADFDKFQIYAKEHDDSEGFDIEHYYYSPSGWWIRVLYPVHDKSTWKCCRKGVKKVLKYLKRKGECTLTYKGGEIKANHDTANLFFVTFLAKDKLGGVNEYQSVFRVQFTNDEIWLHMFRRKGEDKHNDEVARPIFDVRDEYEFYPALKLRRSDFDRESDYDNYHQLYVKEHDESQGFDIKTFISHPTPRLLFQGDYYALRDCKVAVEHVLDYLRSQYEENLELFKITKANYDLYRMYFVTFEARNRVSKQINDYQSVILLDIDRSIDLHMFRKKGDPVHRVKVAKIRKLIYSNSG